MQSEDRQKISLILILIFPIFFWLEAARRTEVLHPPKWRSLYALLKLTPQKPVLIIAFVGGLIFAFALIFILKKLSVSDFSGAPYKKFYRGTRIISKSALEKKTLEKKVEQIKVAGVPMPRKIENLHLLIGGSTGSGKSVLIRELVYSALLRGDRLIIADPNGDMLSKFGMEKDIILNPYDERSQGWSIFNEIRHDYDFKRFALSLVPRGETPEGEEWASYGRLLLSETAQKLFSKGKDKCSIQTLFHWTTIAPPDDLKAFLEGTAAESLFVGATRALASARFILSSKLSSHLAMTTGEFSLRNWLGNPNGGNLFITWREDMAVALRPLISSWVDVLCTSILSLPEDEHRRLWMVIDELASLENLASLEDAATKGRKAGLRLVAGLQSTAQLDKIYGREQAQTLRSCFRSLVVLGGAKTDPKTCEDMSLSLGEHEVERETVNKTSQKGSTGTSRQQNHIRERVVMPSEIASLPDLKGYIAFAGAYDVASIQLTPLNFVNRLPAFIHKAK
jgi:type IV secretory pathway TraG/TraD family ATPase VirD4